MLKEIKINTTKKNEIIDITSKIAELIKDIGEGIVTVFIPHSTAALIINENTDLNLNEDILKCLKDLIPENNWKHNKIDNNATSHIKSSIIGCEKSIPIKQGKLMLGTWQSISLLELDGPRTRKILIKF